MKTETSPVKSKSQVIGTATYNVYETLQEALAPVNEGGIGEKEALRLINVQNKTNAMNRLRQDATGVPSLKTFEDEAYLEIMGMSDADKQQNDIKADRASIRLWVDNRAQELKKAWLAAHPAARTEDEESGEGTAE